MTTLSTRLAAGRPTWQPWLSTAARLFLAGILAFAGWPKLLDAEGTVRSVRAFQILPESLVRPFAYGLPMLELVLALLLLVGLGTRIAGAATAVLMIVFLGGIASAWARGLSIDCGCFGNAGTTVPDPVPGYVRDIFRDLLFLGAAVLLVLSPRSRFSVDGLLGLTPEPLPAAEPVTPSATTTRSPK
jgi:uncharacterized membrane protein YphA (DoxX/SURF4 family)